LLLPAIQLIDIDEEPQRFDVKPGRNNNLWGLPAPGSWIEEATPFLGVEIKAPSAVVNHFVAPPERTPAAAAAS
ncbi:MAG: hypothetical protein J0H62_01145, partial [Rhizobiales bacterium]|nr:hypothetical protein [Hyphomicrobiales bacterium]